MELSPKKLIEIVGIASVVGSLLFVGFQLRQDRTIALADVYATRSETRSANLRAILESDTSLRETAGYRVDVLQNTDFAIPASWKDADDPTIGEARRLRSELNILLWDNWIYQESLGLLDATPALKAIEEMFRADPGLMEFSLQQPWISEYTRITFEEIADKIREK